MHSFVCRWLLLMMNAYLKTKKRNFERSNLIASESFFFFYFSNHIFLWVFYIKFSNWFGCSQFCNRLFDLIWNFVGLKSIINELGDNKGTTNIFHLNLFSYFNRQSLFELLNVICNDKSMCFYFLAYDKHFCCLFKRSMIQTYQIIKKRKPPNYNAFHKYRWKKTRCMKNEKNSYIICEIWESIIGCFKETLCYFVFHFVFILLLVLLLLSCDLFNTYMCVCMCGKRTPKPMR